MPNTIEIEWRPIVGYEKMYEVSEAGVRNKNTKKVRALNLLKSGYLMVTLHNPEKGFYFHRLVAIHFIPNPENKKEVNHKNGIKADNRIENLEWCTKQENMRHGWQNSLMKGSNGGTLTEKDVVDIRESKLSNNEMAEKYKVCASHIMLIRKKKKWKHV